MEMISSCPSEYLLKVLFGKWKPCIFRYASFGPVRFNQLIRVLPGSSRQAIASALRELEESGILKKEVIRIKPLHIEYSLTEKGASFIPVFKCLEEMKLIPPAITMDKHLVS
ncbi:winged helix-turn-helix transcriptional regulator [Mucilaginibacter sp. Mucisp86]|uniref:winged helix-turn-helix transcriptional regulator n=1 Tax=Mucilaginibacter sp. Mucisp86 TaxID=3243060 RepID=UPI0039B6A73C